MSDPEKARHPLPSELLHDLRTPLNHIIGYSEMLIEEAKDGHDEMLPHLQKIHAAGQQLLALMNDNLEAGRGEKE